jgi:hypothetical protein
MLLVRMEGPMGIARVLTIGLFVGCLAACGGEGAVGEECGESGVEDGECEAGAVCGKRSDGSESLECLTICKGDQDCPSDLACKGVAGTDIKGCRAKDAT